MQTICTLLQTDNHTNTSPLKFYRVGCSSRRPTNSVRALKAKEEEQFIEALSLYGMRNAVDKNFALTLVRPLHQDVAGQYLPRHS